MVFVLGGPRQGGEGGDVETARVVMRLFRGRCPFFRRHILFVLRRRLVNVARTRMRCLDADWLKTLAHIIKS